MEENRDNDAKGKEAPFLFDDSMKRCRSCRYARQYVFQKGKFLVIGQGKVNLFLFKHLDLGQVDIRTLCSERVRRNMNELKLNCREFHEIEKAMRVFPDEVCSTWRGHKREKCW